MNKYAVIVGIEYKNLKEKIPNILSRIYDIRKKLVDNEGYIYRNITILTDTNTGKGAFYESLYKPTKVHIFREIERICKKSYSFIDNFEFKFFYIGHGRNIYHSINHSNDECIVPICGNIIITDEIEHILRAFNTNSNIEVILDNHLCMNRFKFLNNYHDSIILDRKEKPFIKVYSQVYMNELSNNEFINMINLNGNIIEQYWENKNMIKNIFKN